MENPLDPSYLLEISLSVVFSIKQIYKFVPSNQVYDTFSSSQVSHRYSASRFKASRCNGTIIIYQTEIEVRANHGSYTDRAAFS